MGVEDMEEASEVALLLEEGAVEEGRRRLCLPGLKLQSSARAAHVLAAGGNGGNG